MTVPSAGWLLDLGNSRLKCARLDARGDAGEVLAFDHADPAFVDTVISRLGPARADDTAWLASVAPASLAASLESALLAAGFKVHRVRTQAACGRLRIAYARPESLGVDRFLALLAASGRSDGPWLLVSAGSAITLDLLAADGTHLGGAIAPTPEAMRAALAARFAQLDVDAGTATDFAADTADAIATGCEGAAVGLVERSLRAAHRRLGAMPTLLVAGGGAGLLAAIEHSPVVLQPTLVIDGLAAYVLEQAR